jgi:hypothetical protein
MQCTRGGFYEGVICLVALVSVLLLSAITLSGAEETPLPCASHLAGEPN